MESSRWRRQPRSLYQRPLFWVGIVLVKIVEPCKGEKYFLWCWFIPPKIKRLFLILAEACRYLACGLAPPVAFSRYQKFDTVLHDPTKAKLMQVILSVDSVPASEGVHWSAYYVSSVPKSRFWKLTKSFDLWNLDQRQSTVLSVRFILYMLLYLIKSLQPPKIYKKSLKITNVWSANLGGTDPVRGIKLK